MSQSISIFVWGAIGSLSVEVFRLHKKQNLTLLLGLPRWELFSYVIVRLAGSLIAGAIAVAYGDNQPLISIAIGASARFIISTMTRIIPSLVATLQKTPKHNYPGELNFQQ